MKHLLILGGLSSLSALATAQQKELFDINRHLKGNKQFSIPSEKAFPLTSGPADPSRLLLQYRLPNGDIQPIHLPDARYYSGIQFRLDSQSRIEPAIK